MVEEKNEEKNTPPIASEPRTERWFMQTDRHISFRHFYKIENI